MICNKCKKDKDLTIWEVCYDCLHQIMLKMFLEDYAADTDDWKLKAKEEGGNDETD